MAAVEAARKGRVVMLGIDGLSWAFLDSPLVSGAMPNLKELFGSSASGPLMSTIPPYTGPAWTSITTGVGPGRHGVFGFTDRAGHPLSDARVGAPRVWDYVGRAGGRSVVVNVPLTYPPRPIEGLLVSGMPVPTGSPYTYPEDLAGRLESDIGYVVDVSILGSPRPGPTLERLAHMTELRGRAIASLARSETWDLLSVVFVLPDRLGHPWWKQLVPGSPLYETKAGSQLRDAARGALVALDNAIGEVLGALPAGTAVVACSDHGFGPLQADVFFDVALARAGFIQQPSGTGVLKLAGRVARSPVGRLVPRRLLDRTKTRLARPAAERKAWTAPKFEWGVCLADGADQGIRDEVIGLLEELEDPQGRRIFKAIRARQELFTGPRVEDAPDLFPFTTSEDVELHEGLHANDHWLDRRDVPWGTHASEGVVAVSGIEAKRRIAGDAVDVTPTLLALLSIGVDGLDGKSLVDTGPPATTVTADAVEGTGEVYDAEQEAAVMEHLRGLGYVE